MESFKSQNLNLFMGKNDKFHGLKLKLIPRIKKKKKNVIYV